jgi:glycosyltransferase involved in cell wall biosynthesis
MPDSNRAVSIVIPSYDAAATLAETLASVQAQTYPHWEAVIVDDGSTDDTAEIAASWAEKDSRFRLVRQGNGGHSAARNAGIRTARYQWLVCLDCDDWIAPEFLERMVRRATAKPAVDAVVCGCVCVASSGRHGRPAVYGPTALVDAFPAFARDCPIAIHNCMVRRALVEEVGGFDTGLVVCEDWDLWQRIARAGARFATIPEVLAFYRMRPGSVSRKAERALTDGWSVLRRGHGRDPRVPAPDPRYADGLPAAGLPEALFRQAVWAGCLMIVQGEDARSLLPLMGEQRAPALSPAQAAAWFFEYVPDAASLEKEDWPALWPKLADRIAGYLEGLEAQSAAPDLARRCVFELARLIADAGDDPASRTISSRMRRLRARLSRKLRRLVEKHS